MISLSASFIQTDFIDFLQGFHEHLRWRRILQQNLTIVVKLFILHVCGDHHCTSVCMKFVIKLGIFAAGITKLCKILLWKVLCSVFLNFEHFVALFFSRRDKQSHKCHWNTYIDWLILVNLSFLEMAAV